MKKLFVAAMFVLFGALFACVSWADTVQTTTNDWFDADFTTGIAVDSAVVVNSTTGITHGAGSWTSVPTNGTATIVADADAGEGATCLSLKAPGEDLTLTPALFSATTGLEAVSVQIKADAMDELPSIGVGAQAAFTVHLDEGDALSAMGWTAGGWTNLVYAGVDALTNAWATFTVEFKNAGGVRYVRYSVKPASGSLAVLGDSAGTTWFQAGANAETINSVSLSGTGSVRSINGDSIEVSGVATYNGVGYDTFAEAIAAGKADNFAAGAVTLLADATWTPTATGDYEIDVNGFDLSVRGTKSSSGTTYTISKVWKFWVGGASGDWRTGANWDPAGTPNNTDVCAFTNDVAVNLDRDSDVASAKNAVAYTYSYALDGCTVTLSSTNSAGELKRFVGNSIVAQDGGKWRFANADVTLRTGGTTAWTGDDYAFVDGSTNVLRTSGQDLSWTGAMSGNYVLAVSTTENVTLSGDNSGFRGTLVAATEPRQNKNGLHFSNAGSISSLASYSIPSGCTAKVSFNTGAATFGELTGTGTLKVDNGNIADNDFVVDVGGLGTDFGCGVKFDRYTASSKAASIRKSGSGTMDFNVRYPRHVYLAGGAAIVTNAMSYLNVAGDIKFLGGRIADAGDAAVADVSGYVKNSTSAIDVDIANDATWGTALAASNAGGLTKRGSGTLTLSAGPAYSGVTTLLGGTLVVPQDTTIAELAIDGGKLSVPIAGTENDESVLTITALADGTTAEDLETAVAIPGVTMSVTSDGGSGYIVMATRNPQTFVWTGAADTAWENGANWTVGGVAATTAPLAIDAVVFPANDDGWSVTISADAVASNIVFNANAEIAAGTCKITTTEISGSGKLTAKGLKLRAPANSNLSIYAPVEIPEGYVFETSVSTQYKHVYLYSKVTGAGTWNMNQDSTNQRGSVQFRGDNGADMSEFAGSLVVINMGPSIRDQTAIYEAVASSSNAVWTLYGFAKESDDSSSLLKNANTTYYFGALNGYVCASGNQSNHNKNTWEIGAREDVDSVLSGNFFQNTYHSLIESRSDTIRKVGAGSTLTFSGSRVRAYEANAGVLKLASANALLTTWDGGSYAPSIAFNGGTLKLDESVTLDVSTNIAKVASTSAIAFDDEGIDRTWEVELPGTGGLVKKGDGTLTLKVAPAYTGTTYLDGGVLKMPVTKRVRTHVEGKRVVRSFETVDGVVYTVYTLADGEAPLPTILMLK